MIKKLILVFFITINIYAISSQESFQMQIEEQVEAIDEIIYMIEQMSLQDLAFQQTDHEKYIDDNIEQLISKYTKLQLMLIDENNNQYHSIFPIVNFCLKKTNDLKNYLYINGKSYKVNEGILFYANRLLDLMYLTKIIYGFCFVGDIDSWKNISTLLLMKNPAASNGVSSLERKFIIPAGDEPRLPIHDVGSNAWSSIKNYINNELIKKIYDIKLLCIDSFTTASHEKRKINIKLINTEMDELVLIKDRLFNMLKENNLFPIFLSILEIIDKKFVYINQHWMFINNETSLFQNLDEIIDLYIPISRLAEFELPEF